MSEFTFLFRGRDTAASPEEMQRHMKKWTSWFQGLTAQGFVSGPGYPLGNSGAVVKGRQKALTDGPYAETKDMVGGFMLIEAKDLAHAVELAKGCPLLDADGSVEVRPIHKS